MSETLIVCLKPVWRTDVALRLDESGRAVRAEEATRGLGAADLAALRRALDLRDGGTVGPARVLALTVGPQPAAEALREALAAGADEAVRVWGADWPTDAADALDGAAGTTRALAEAAAAVAAPREPALVLCGERSGDTGHECFGAFLARALGAAHAHRAAELAAADGGWRVGVKLERGYVQAMTLARPAVVTVAAGGARPAYASLPAWMESRRAAIPVADPGTPRPSAPHTTLRAPVPRVKRYTVPPSDLGAEARIRAMVTLESGGGGTLVEAEAGAGAQAEAILRLLRERGYC